MNVLAGSHSNYNIQIFDGAAMAVSIELDWEKKEWWKLEYLNDDR